MHFPEDGTIGGTARYGLFEATMDWETYTPLSVVQRCELTNLEHLGSLAHIPSGGYKDNLMLANHDSAEVSILRLNPDRTCQTDFNGAPRMVTLIDGLEASWFKGFVPGVNQQTIYDNLDANGNRIAESLTRQGECRRKLLRRELSHEHGFPIHGLTGLKGALVNAAGTLAFDNLLVKMAKLLEESEYYQRCLNNGDNDPEAIEAYIDMADLILDALQKTHAIISIECPSSDLAIAFAEEVELLQSSRTHVLDR